MVFAAAAVLISVGPAIAYWHDRSSLAPDVAGLTKPMHLQDWHQAPPDQLWRPAFPGVDAQVSGSLVSDKAPTAPPVDFYVGFYGRARTGHSLTSHVNKLWHDNETTAVSSRLVSAQIGHEPLRLLETTIVTGAQKRIVWSSYWVDGVFTTSLLRVKLLQAKSALVGHEGEAVIAVSTTLEESEETARQRLSNALVALGDLPDRLNSANHRDVMAKAPD